MIPITDATDKTPAKYVAAIPKKASNEFCQSRLSASAIKKFGKMIFAILFFPGYVV